jgi:hypothetical protein
LTNGAANFLGTTDAQPLDVRVNGTRALRIEPHATSPRLIGGHSENTATAGAYGANIAGGGATLNGNQVTDNCGTVGGGWNNRAGNANDTADGNYSFAAGRRAKAYSQGCFVLADVPIETWNLKSQPDSIRPIGPMAQDFAAAFGVGEDDKHIGTVDADGVALAAIQGFYRLLQQKDEQIAALTARVT